MASYAHGTTTIRRSPRITATREDVRCAPRDGGRDLTVRGAPRAGGDSRDRPDAERIAYEAGGQDHNDSRGSCARGRRLDGTARTHAVTSRPGVAAGAETSEPPGRRMEHASSSRESIALTAASTSSAPTEQDCDSSTRNAARDPSFQPGPRTERWSYSIRRRFAVLRQRPSFIESGLVRRRRRVLSAVASRSGIARTRAVFPARHGLRALAERSTTWDRSVFVRKPGNIRLRAVTADGTRARTSSPEPSSTSGERKGSRVESSWSSEAHESRPTSRLLAVPRAAAVDDVDERRSSCVPPHATESS